MDRTPLQQRAESLSLAFRQSKRPALVVEFAGVPKAGKTSTLGQVYSFLRRCGFRCEIVVERASVCPIRDKKHFNFNIWTACTSLAQLLEKTQNPPHEDDPDILFLDRGIFDSICWMTMLERLGRIRPVERKETTDFLLGSDWVRRVSGVIAMSASPSDAMTREQGYLSVQGREGSIMNTPVLSQMGEVLRETMDALKNSFRIFHVDTSSDDFSHKPKETCEAVAARILDWVEESVEEQILSVEKAEFPNLGDKFVTSAAEAAEMIARFEEKGIFAPRRNVEADLTRIQPLPVVVVRNNSGQVLRLVRKESDSSSNRHKKITVWAGGHVRREDSPRGKGAISAGAIRELEEELRLFATSDQLHLLGAIYLNLEPTSKKHVAFVYEWRAQMDVVEVALCNSEFVEKGGTSLQGAFMPPEQIAAESNLEAWSAEILSSLLIGSGKDSASKEGSSFSDKG
jgi:predicted NUDIX family phosphoesterase